MAIFSVQYFTKQHEAKTKIVHARDEDDAIKSVTSMLLKNREFWDECDFFEALKIEKPKYSEGK